MKAILQGFYQKEHFWLRLGVVLLAVFGMGFALSAVTAGGYGNRSLQYDEQGDFHTDRYEFRKLAGNDEYGTSCTGSDLRRKKSWIWNTGEYVSLSDTLWIFSPGSGIGCCRQTFLRLCRFGSRY